ncbi:hypothetical protein F442_22723 [Phytophthora nicotianae P10297]|uniref:Uncharacterized protein n=1 Tax=Phytophthora nicotianae P10297 TaxID=1317064 RepID=W2XZR9_PHYNI|nr:hypothetical protein F442_22723 [Phytophthora nicotianae P10297]
MKVKDANLGKAFSRKGTLKSRQKFLSSASSPVRHTPKKCFHCEGEHEFINCPTATEADKAAICEKRRAEFKGRQQKKRG